MARRSRRNWNSPRVEIRDRPIHGGIDYSYYDDSDEFWRPIREADERDEEAHAVEVIRAEALTRKRSTAHTRR